MKNLKSRIALSILLLAISGSSFAFSECVREVKNVFTDFQTVVKDGTGSITSGNEMVYICFTTGSCIFKTIKQLTDGQMARFFSMGLTAKTTGKKLQVRYPEDDVTCPPVSVSARSDVLGMWLVQ